MDAVRATKFFAAMALIGSAMPIASTFGQPASPEPEAPAVPQGPVRPLLYYFEHFSLREAAFHYDQDIQALIANPMQAGDPVARLFAKAALWAAGAPDFSETEFIDDVRVFMRQIGFDTFHIDGYTLHLMKMPPPEYPPEAYFVAIVYKDGEPLVEGVPAPSTRYITFEKTPVEGRAVAVGEWDVNGQHKTHGFGNRELTVPEVIANVHALLGIHEP